MKTKGVIFDKDGTLLDFEALWTEVAFYALRHIFKQLDISEKWYTGALRAIGVKEDGADVDGVLCKGTYGDVSQTLHGYFTENGIQTQWKQVYAVTVDAFHKSADKGKIAPTCPDIRGTLNALKSLGIKLAVMTSDDTFVTEKCLRALGIDDLFDVIYTDDGTHPNKPDPYCINAFCEAFGLKKEEVAMVGDSLTDVTFAKNGGVFAVGVAKTKENAMFLTGKADVVVHDISLLKEVLA